MNFNTQANFNNNNFNNSFNNNNNNKHENQLKKTLEKIHKCMQLSQLVELTTVIQLSQQLVNQNFQTFNFQLPTRDYNINSAIVQKCLMVKQRNQQIKLKVLNLRGNLVRLMPNNRKKWPNERKYQQVLQQIRSRGVNLRQKIQRCRNMPVQRSQIVHNQQLMSDPIRQIKKATEWLQKQTIMLRKEFNLLIKTIPEDKSSDL